MSEPIVVTGIHTGIPPGAKRSDYPARLEWTEFAKNDYFVFLFAHALKKMQEEEQVVGLPLSFFQVGAIHGLPKTPWDNAPPGPGGYLYCNHGVPTFPTWHRPYVALYEQALAQHFLRIISWYTGQFKADLQAAADGWRLPYWEWATDKPTIPEMFCTPTLDIIRPASNKVGYETDPKPMDPNPFASYKFHPIDDSFFGTWKIYPTTLRCPNSKKATAHSQPAEINKNLQAKVDFKKKTWELFQTTQWTTFSNASMKAADGTGPMTSLEGIHDAVHLCTGGTQTTDHGHMCSRYVAAFDPVFWMHHCQVERLLTLWQTINYKTPVPDIKDQLALPLYPFRKDATAMASSAEIQDTLVYGYIYPEIKAHPNTTPAQLAELVRDDVDRLYGGSNLMEAFQAPTDEAKLSKATAALEIVSSGSQAAISAPKISAQTIRFTKSNPGDPYDLNPDTYQEWIVNVAIDKSALGGSGRILFFFGADSEIPEDPKEWADHPSYIGVYDLFAPEDPEECQNCSELQEAGYKVGGTVFLTKELILRGIALVGDQPENYLKENLQVRGFGLSTQQVYTPETLPSLELSIQSAGYETTPGIGAPGRARRKEWQIHRGVTGGRLNEAPASEA